MHLSQQNIIPDRKSRIGRALHDIASFYREDALKLAHLLYKKGVTTTEISLELGVSKAAISQKYPRKSQKGTPND